MDFEHLSLTESVSTPRRVRDPDVATRNLVSRRRSDCGLRANFGFYDEGSGVYSLYLSPMDARTVTRVLFPYSRSYQLLVSTPLPAPEGCMPLATEGWSGSSYHLLGLQPPIEALVFDPSVVSLARLEQQLPASLLGNPEAALPEGVRFALCMLDNQHAVVLSRERPLFVSTLEALIVSLEADFGIHQPPHISSDAMDSLLQPQDPWNWWEIECGNYKRFHTLDIASVDGLCRDEPNTGMRWVAPKGNGWWRSGWTW